MTPLLLRALEHCHGHVGWISAVALVHPAILFRKTRRRALSVAIAATVLVTLTAALGAVMYPGYRSNLKPLIFAMAPVIGNAFERKEHWGVAALALAWIGLALHWINCRASIIDHRLARSAFIAYVGAAGFAVLAAASGVVVATHRTF